MYAVGKYHQIRKSHEIVQLEWKRKHSVDKSKRKSVEYVEIVLETLE